MKKAITSTIIIFLAAVFSGCEKNADLAGMPEFVSKLVIGAFLSPDDSISYIHVSANQRIYGEINNDNTPGKYDAWLSDGEKEIKLDTISGYLFFRRKDMQIVPGKTYYFRIESDRGMKAKSSCTVPDAYDFMMKADTFSILHEAVSPYEHAWRERMLKLSFRDQPGKENYYQVIAEITGYYLAGGYPPHPAVIRQTIYPDQRITGSLTSDGAVIERTLSHINTNWMDSAFMTVRLMSYEKSFLLYTNSLYNYKDGSNPFTEATPFYSNIEGGLGIFTSYITDSLVFRIK